MENQKIDRYYPKKPFVFYKSHAIDLNGKIYELGEWEYISILSYLNGVLSIPFNDSKNFLKEIENKFITKERPSFSKRLHVILELTLNCNLNCRYCFNRLQRRKKYKLELRHWTYIISRIPKNSIITLFGGEPFLYKDIYRLLKYIEENDKNYIVRVFTNGTLAKRIVNILKNIKKQLYILVSIDGPEDVHDMIRGKGNYKKTKETLKQIKKYANWHKIIIKTTVSKLNVDRIEEMLEDLDGLFDYITFGELHPSGKAKEHEDEIIWIKDWFFKIYSIQEKYKIRDVTDEDFYNRCGFGYNLIYIREDGFIAGCTEYPVYYYQITDLFAYPNKDLREFIPIKLPNENCLHCNLFWACRGGCRNQARILTGNWDECDLKRKKYVIDFLEFLIKKND